MLSKVIDFYSDSISCSSRKMTTTVASSFSKISMQRPGFVLNYANVMLTVTTKYEEYPKSNS